MEGLLAVILQSGNIVAIVCFIVCYLVIYFQRKSTSEKRNSKEIELQQQIELANKKAEEAEQKAKEKMEEAQNEIQEQIIEFNTEKLLMQKDIENLKAENIGIKMDIKEIKTTLQTMALALERIAAAYDIKDKK